MHGIVIGIEGIIGVGKTTLARKLARALNLRFVKEPVEENPYLALFYDDPVRWSFATQMELLHRRHDLQQLAAHEDAGGEHRGAVLDRTLIGDRGFAQLLLKLGYLTDLEWRTYDRAFNTMSYGLRSIDLLLFLDAEPSVALQRKEDRGREVEVGVDIEYLKGLRGTYDDLMTEIEKRRSPWAREVGEIWRLDWNQNNRSLEGLVQALRKAFDPDALSESLVENAAPGFRVQPAPLSDRSHWEQERAKEHLHQLLATGHPDGCRCPECVEVRGRLGG